MEPRPAVCFTGEMATDEHHPAASHESGAVPLIEACPACGSPVEGQKCKIYCPNDTCILYRRIIENCAGD